MRLRSILLSLLLLVVSGALLAPAAWALCAPSVRGIFPASGAVGTTVNATVQGDGLTGAVATVYGEPGLTANVTATNDTSVQLQLVIAADAAPGERIITFETAAGVAAASFTVNGEGGPVITGTSLALVATQGFGLDVTLQGQGLAGLTAENVTVSGNGVTVSDAMAVGDTELQLSFDVASDADVGTHAIVISSDAGGVILQLYVQRPEPKLTAVSPAAGEVGTVVNLTLTGEHLTGAALVVTSGDKHQGGVTISGVSTPDDATLVATLTISNTLSAEAEPRLLILTTESGQVTTEFHVVAKDVPSITSVRPAAGEPNTTVPVTIHGLNLTGATLSTSSGTITLENPVIVDDETATVDVVVPSGAATNTNHTITATVGMANSSTTFRVIPTGTPFIGALRPPFGNRGTTVALIVDGVNLAGVTPGTGVDLSSSGIVESNAQALDAYTVRCLLDIDVSANAGNRDVTVTTTGGSYTVDRWFRVNIPGQVPTITDVSPTVVDPGTTTQITVTGSGFFGAGVAVGGAGATVTNIAVNGAGDSLTFDLTLAEDAPAESRPLIVVTENGTATCGILSTGANIELRSALIVKTGAVFDVVTTGYRLFLFEFSINENFETGLRTYVVPSAEATLTLTRLQAENVGRAVRDVPWAYVRVRAVSATNFFGLSAPARVRR